MVADLPEDKKSGAPDMGMGGMDFQVRFELPATGVRPGSLPSEIPLRRGFAFVAQASSLRVDAAGRHWQRHDNMMERAPISHKVTRTTQQTPLTANAYPAVTSHHQFRVRQMQADTLNIRPDIRAGLHALAEETHRGETEMLKRSHRGLLGPRALGHRPDA